jgi:hypothetical protein
MRKLKLIIAALFLSSPFAANATVFEFVCDSVDCNGDTGFTFTVELLDSVVVANGGYSTGSDAEAGFIGWSFTSNTTSGSALNGTSAEVTNDNPYVGFSFDALGILDGIWDTDNATNTGAFTGGTTALVFGSVAAGGRIIWYEPSPNSDRVDVYRVQGPQGSSFLYPGSGSWQRVSVPEPGTLALLTLGLAGMGMTRRKKKA